eukprot:1924473-Rhodomonas_salina.1
MQVHDIEFAPSLDVIVNETLPALENYLRGAKSDGSVARAHDPHAHRQQHGPSLTLRVFGRICCRFVTAGKAKMIGITGYPLGPLKEVLERSK